MRTEPSSSRYSLLSATLVLALAFAGTAQAQVLPLEPGEVAVTCHSGYCWSTPSTPYPNCAPGYVVAVIDTRDPAGNGAVLDQHWSAPADHNDGAGVHEWNRANLGEVFGITLDGATPPNIYVTATTIYGDFVDGGGSDIGFGPGGTGGEVYRLNGITGDISLCVQLPNTGAALGNIAYDENHDQFYVSNLDDGLIYRVDVGGCNVIDTFDHGIDGRPNESLATIPDAPASEFTPFGRRVWGVEEYRGRLYYAVWNEDQGCDPTYTYFGAGRGCLDVTLVDNEIWSVAIDPTTGGFMLATAQREITLPTLDDGPNTYPDNRISNPVTDIDFTADGRMLLAERTRILDTGRGVANALPGSPWDAHRARVLEYTGSSGSWTPSPEDLFRVGWAWNSNNNLCWNSAGGVSSDCAGNAWCAGDMLHGQFPYGGQWVYGIQRIGPLGNQTDNPSTLNSYLIDYDGQTTPASGSDKTQIGDVVVYDPGCECMVIDVVDVVCAGNGFEVTLDITNQSGFTGEHVMMTPQGTFTISPQQQDIPTLLDGDTAQVTFQITGAASGDTVCFYLTLLKDDFQACCTEEVCIELPECCWAIKSLTLECDPTDPTKYVLDATLVNLTGADVYYAYIILPASLSNSTPTYFDFSTAPIPPNGTADIDMTICGATAGSTECIWVTAHNAMMEECCSQKLTLTFPYCGVELPQDCCLVTQVVPCCLSTVSGQITLTICNKSAVARSYDWDIDGLAPAGNCTEQLLNSDFTPSFGTVGPIPPGTCIDIPIVVDCASLILPAPACALYGVTVTNPATGDMFGCQGIVQWSDTTVKDDPGGGLHNVVDVPLGTTVALGFRVERATGSGPIDVELIDMEPLGGFDLLVLSLDGLPPGLPVARQVNPSPGTFASISVNLSFVPGTLPGTIENLSARTDLDGDGAPDLAAHVIVRAVPPGLAPFPRRKPLPAGPLGPVRRPPTITIR